MKSKQALGNRDHRGNPKVSLSPSMGDQAFDMSDVFLMSLETKDFLMRFVGHILIDINNERRMI